MSTEHSALWCPASKKCVREHPKVVLEGPAPHPPQPGHRVGEHRGGCLPQTATVVPIAVSFRISELSCMTQKPSPEPTLFSMLSSSLSIIFSVKLSSAYVNCQPSAVRVAAALKNRPTVIFLAEHSNFPSNLS